MSLPRIAGRTDALRLAALFVLCGALIAPQASTCAQAPPSEGDAETRLIRGRVADKSGEPIAGAVVRVQRQDLHNEKRDQLHERWAEPIVVATGEDGTFVVPGLEGDLFHVRAESPGRAPTNAEQVPAGAWLSLHLPEGRELRGRVIDAQKERAVPGAEVFACDPLALRFGLEACARTMTDEEGAYAFPALPDGLLQLRAQAPGHAVTPLLNLELTAGREDEVRVLRLRPGARVAGRVVDENGEGVPGARITVRPLASSVADLTSRRAGWPAFAGADGAFELAGVAAGPRFAVFASRPDRGSANSRALEVDAAGDITELELVLPSPARLAVRLVDDEGRPIESVEVHVRPSAKNSGWKGLPERWIENRDAGRFEISVVGSGPHDVIFAPDAFGELRMTEIELRPGRRIDLGERVVPGGIALFGRVADPDDAAVPGAFVRASWMKDAGLPRGRETTTDRDGLYRMDGLDEIPIEIEVSAAGFTGETLDDVLPDGNSLDITLRPSGGVAGRIVDEEDDQLEAFLIVIHVEAESETAAPERFEDFPRQASFADAEDGAYEVRDLPAGAYTVEARSPNLAPGRQSGVEVEEGQVTDVPKIELGRGLVIEGRVVVSETETPVVGAEVSAGKLSGSMIAPPATRKSTAASDEDGRFRLEGLEPGPHRIAARHADHAPAEERVELREDDATAEVTLRLSRGGTLKGTVRDAEGDPAPRRHIMLYRDLADTDVVDYATTDSHGRYELERIAPGTYSATMSRKGNWRPVFKTAVIRDGEVTVLDFDDATPITLTGTAYRDGEPLARATLFFARSIRLSEINMTTSDGSGRFEIGFDDPGRYRVLVEGASTEIDVPDVEFSEQDIHLGSDGLRGTVSDGDGLAVAGAVVAATPLDGSAGDQAAFLVAETGADGSYVIEGLRPGAYRVTASATGHKVATQSIEVAEGAGVLVVDFRLEPGGSIRGRLIGDQGHGISGAPVLAAPSGSADPWGAAASTAITDVNGTFSLTTPGDGPLDVTALPTGWAVVHRVGVVPPVDDDELVLRATHGGTLRVRLVDADGMPRSGMSVTLRPSPAYLGSHLLQLLRPPSSTDASGTAVFPNLAPGTYAVSLPSRPDLPPAAATLRDNAESLLLIELP